LKLITSGSVLNETDLGDPKSFAGEVVTEGSVIWLAAVLLGLVAAVVSRFSATFGGSVFTFTGTSFRTGFDCCDAHPQLMGTSSGKLNSIMVGELFRNFSAFSSLAVGVSDLS
jgi:hypothetical protein